MIKYSLYQKYFNSSNFLWCCISCLSFFAFISCNHQTSLPAQNATTKKLPDTNNTTINSFVAPTIIRITAANQPKVIKAGKPIIKIDPSGTGIPFFTNYGTDQGLPVSHIICSFSDRAGNLWFGSGTGGLSKYDGKSFTNYTMAQGLAGDNVFCVAQDKEGFLWIGTTSGLSKYDGNKFINYTTSQGLADNFVTCAILDNKHNLWFGTHDGGVSKYDGKCFKNYSTKQGLAGNYVRCMMQDNNGNLWFGTDAGGVSRYNGSSFTNFTKAGGLPNNSVMSIAQDGAGNIWFGTNAGVSKYNGESFMNYTTTQGLPDNNVTCILQDKNSNLWFGTHTKGVSMYDGHRFANYTKAEGLAGDKINSITMDRDENIWTTSMGGGASKYAGNSFKYYTTAEGLAGNLVFSSTNDKRGNIWFGTYEGGVSKYDGKCFATYTKAQGLPDNTVWSMMTDRAGNIWVGTDRAGVSKYDGKNFTNYSTAQGLAGNAVSSMMQDKAGNIWLGTRASGVSEFDGRSFTNYGTAQGLAGNDVWSILQDKGGNIWFGTVGGGISKFDGKRFTNYTSVQGFAGNAVTSMIQDKNGNIWFGTLGKGVSKYDGKNFTNYTSEQGLSDNDIWGIAEDTVRQIIWFATKQGLSGLKEKRSFNGNGPENEFENFNKNTGYPITDASTSVPIVDKKGILWAGSAEGKLIRFDYSAITRKNKTPLNLEIEDVKVNNGNICWNNLLRLRKGSDASDSLTLLNEMITTFGKVLSPVVLDSMGKKYHDIELDAVTRFYPVPVNLVLPYEDNNITIDFVAIEPAMPKQVKYQYRLEGYNKEWSPLSNNSSAVFGNIGSGKYIFELKAVSPFGVWSETEYTFKVLPPWWLTWWAYTLWALLAFAIMYTFYSNHIRRIERRQEMEINIMQIAQEEERKRISQDLHDDIGARLTNINMLSALGQQKIKDPPEMSEYLKRISNEIQTSTDALDDIVWSIDTKNDSIEEVTARMRRYAADIFDGTGTRYTIAIDEKFLPAKLSTGKRRDLFFVFKETITNIQKHAGATNIKITMSADDNGFSMQVSDNGKGFDTGQPTHRNGLKNIEHRIYKWGGTFTVQSSPGKGASLKIKLPVSNPSLKRGIWKRVKNR